MKKFLALFLILASLFTTVSCSDKGVPDGMQLVRGGDRVGYYFYAPEEWTVANLGEIASAYASNVDSSSVSYVEVAYPDCTVAEYFKNSLDEFPTPPKMVYENQPTSFGNAENAIMYVYDHIYSEHTFRTMQIFVSFEGRFGIFTFTSPLEHKSAEDESVTQYDFYEEKRQSIIDNFKFVTKSGESAGNKSEYETDAEGYRLVSDASVSKFSLYLPEDFTVDYSSGITSATLSDGSNITMSKATNTGVDVGTYFETRLDELSKIVSDIAPVEFEDENGEIKTVNGNAKFGNASSAASQEYTFVYNGTTYHVYQVCAVTTFNGFVFTYTATEENYYKHLDTVLKVAEKVELK